MRPTRAWVWAGLAVLTATMLVGCARGPDEATLRREVQEKLTKQVKDGLLEVASLGRKGSAPLPSGEQGTKRLVVYYNAALRFRQDYDFGGWEKLSPASLGYALGATEKGLFGIKPQNRAGDVLYVYGTSTYEWSGGAWKSVATARERRRRGARPREHGAALPVEAAHRQAGRDGQPAPAGRSIPGRRRSSPRSWTGPRRTSSAASRAASTSTRSPAVPAAASTRGSGQRLWRA